jgi:hypothetical protein
MVGEDLGQIVYTALWAKAEQIVAEIAGGLEEGLSSGELQALEDKVYKSLIWAYKRKL